MRTVIEGGRADFTSELSFVLMGPHVRLQVTFSAEYLSASSAHVLRVILGVALFSRRHVDRDVTWGDHVLNALSDTLDSNPLQSRIGISVG